MNNNNKTALVPRLRFSEFNTTGEWKTCTLSNLASRITTRNQDNTIKRVLTNSAIDGVVDQSDYFNREVANLNNLENYFVIDEGDYVYNPRISVSAPVGPISKNKVGKGVISPLYTVFRFKNHNNDFYEQYFRTNLWHYYLKNVSNTGARHDRMNISNDSFMKMPLPYHSEKEQQKIADCLSLIDDLIAAENKKLEALRVHKKGLMQKLFPVEEKTVPQVRFEGYTDTWERQKLGEIAHVTKLAGFEFTKYIEYSDNGKVIALRGLNVKNNNLVLDDVKYIDNSDFTKLSRSKLYKGDIIFTYVGTVGQSAIIPDDDKYYLAPNVARIRVNTNISPLFVNQQMGSSNFYNTIISPLIATSSQPALSMENVRKFEINLPSLEEQIAIGEFFRNIDELVIAQEEKIETLTMHKKGLMQGLFPYKEEVGE